VKDEIWINSAPPVKITGDGGYNDRTYILSFNWKGVVLVKINPDINLTKRQQEIADLLVAGCTVRQIAERLHITQRVVTFHITRIRRRLGVSTRAQLIALLVNKRSRAANEDNA
jgi:DNA-binding CsgD family transcriptional regulator